MNSVLGHDSAIIRLYWAGDTQRIRERSQKREYKARERQTDRERNIKREG